MAIAKITGSNLTNAAGSLITVLDTALLPNGWTKLYSGTNKAVYRSTDGVTQCCLRVSDAGTTYATINAYETMSDVDTGTNPFPAAGALYAHKSGSATGRAWRVITDGSFFYLLADYNGSNWSSALWFGDIHTFANADNFHAFLLAAPTTTYNSSTHSLLGGNTTGSYLARSYTQVAGAISAGRYSHVKATAFFGAVLPYPSPVGNGVVIAPVEVWEGTTQLRGRLPGLYASLNTTESIPDATQIDTVPPLLGRTLEFQSVPLGGGTSTFCFDLTGPWRTVEEGT